MLKKKTCPEKKTSRIEKHKWQELKKAMERGGLHQLEGGSDWKTLFREATGLLNYDTTIQNQVFEQLVQREELSSTALGNGIAVPHPRIPMKLELRESLVLSLFLNQPVNLKAPDKKPVYSLFLLLSCEAREHLQFLSQIAMVLHEPSMPEFINKHPNQEQLFEQFHQVLA